jgi:hypothetical protein
MTAVGDPTGRMAGQHARAMVQRLRLRTLLTLGILAVATGALGRGFGLHDVRFIASELALLASMFCISRYVLPLVERRDRGASAEEHVGGLLEGLAGWEWRVIHDASFGRGNIDHILIGPPGAFTVETKSHPGLFAWGGFMAARCARPRRSGARSNGSRDCPSNRCWSSATPGSTAPSHAGAACAWCPRGCCSAT